MSVAVGIGPAEVLELDACMFDALELEAAAAAKRWTVEQELAASTLEVLHANGRAFLAANSKKGARLPPALRIPRPDDDEQGKRSGSSEAVSASAFAAMFAGVVVPELDVDDVELAGGAATEDA